VNASISQSEHVSDYSTRDAAIALLRELDQNSLGGAIHEAEKTMARLREHSRNAHSIHTRAASSANSAVIPTTLSSTMVHTRRSRRLQKLSPYDEPASGSRTHMSTQPAMHASMCMRSSSTGALRNLLQSRVVQLGQARSASTFQWYLLTAVLRARNVTSRVEKHHNASYIRASRKPTMLFVSRRSHNDALSRRSHNDALSRRSHNDALSDEKLSAMVQSWPAGSCVAHVQQYESFSTRSQQQIGYYARLFGLSVQAEKLVFAHMRFWAILRQCCGSQSSIDNRLHVHSSRRGGGNSTASNRPRHSVDDPDYPACEMYSLSAVEQLVLATALSIRSPNEVYIEYGHAALYRGWCSHELAKLESGFDFNGKRLPNVDVDGEPLSRLNDSCC